MCAVQTLARSTLNKRRAKHLSICSSCQHIQFKLLQHGGCLRCARSQILRLHIRHVGGHGFHTNFVLPERTYLFIQKSQFFPNGRR